LEEYWVEFERILSGNGKVIGQKLEEYWVEAGRILGRKLEESGTAVGITFDGS
jgi:hypothetical protein